MNDFLSHAEIQELLGAFALGAVDGRERAVVAAHLETCESCRAELDDHRRLARALSRHASRVSPLASMESNGSSGTGKAERPRPVRRWTVPVAVAIVLVIFVGLFAQAQVRFNEVEARIDRIELLGRAQLATADPAAVVTALRTPGGEPALTVVSRTGGGTSYAMNSALPPLGEGQTYELWRIDNTGVTAVVALGRRPDTVRFSLAAPSVTGFLLTVETGSPPSRPTLPAVATGRVAF
ncbi:MAG: anti-sigma factor [Actinomycetota bacterium]|nr:anti-sigma factor [Actinomycetota bacterium]